MASPNPRPDDAALLHALICSDTESLLQHQAQTRLVVPLILSFIQHHKSANLGIVEKFRQMEGEACKP